MNYTVYVLRSSKNGKQYIGYTSKSLKTRLDWYRWGMNSWTKQNSSFSLVYCEEKDNEKDAIRREKYFKTGQGRRTLKYLISKSTRYGGGSSPPQSMADSLIANIKTRAISSVG